MKLVASVSLIALALAGCATTGAPAAPMAVVNLPTAPAAQALTAEDARAFLAAVEKDLFDYTVESSQVNWVNATYITEDTDALAAMSSGGSKKPIKGMLRRSTP